jgi:hypothetical protein
MPVPDLVFAQPARRNILVPVLLALFILGIVVALLLRFTPRRTATLTIAHTAILPTHTIFKGESILVGRDTAQDDLYVVTTLRVEDNLRLPLFIKDLTATLVTAEGQQIATSAAEEHDLPNIYTSFPALKPLSSAPLLRETLINSGETAQGMVLLHFPVTQSVWDHRRSATVTVDLYHQGPQDAVITRASEAVKIPKATPVKESTE